MLNEPDESDVSDEVTEARIRRSLGLMSSPTPHGNQTGNSHSNHHHNASGPHGSGGHGSGGGAIQRRRFVRDGEVPVVIVHPKSEAEGRHAASLADMTRQRDAERTARLRAEQALQEAQAMIQTLQTRIAHSEIAKAEIHQAEIALAEAVVAESVRADIAQADAIRTVALRAETMHEAPKPARLAMTDEPVSPVVQPPDEAVGSSGAAQPRPRGRGRIRLAKQAEPASGEEPTPVKWWR